MTFTQAKLKQIADVCSATLHPTFLGQLFEDDRYSFDQIAAALSTSPAMLQRAINLPEPIVYAATTTEDVAPVSTQ
jgi:hypothetical protein